MGKTIFKGGEIMAMSSHEAKIAAPGISLFMGQMVGGALKTPKKSAIVTLKNMDWLLDKVIQDLMYGSKKEIVGGLTAESLEEEVWYAGKPREEVVNKIFDDVIKGFEADVKSAKANKKKIVDEYFKKYAPTAGRKDVLVPNKFKDDDQMIAGILHDIISEPIGDKLVKQSYKEESEMVDTIFDDDLNEVRNAIYKVMTIDNSIEGVAFRKKEPAKYKKFSAVMTKLRAVDKEIAELL
jgi:hypothetical protein